MTSKVANKSMWRTRASLRTRRCCSSKAAVSAASDHAALHARRSDAEPRCRARVAVFQIGVGNRFRQPQPGRCGRHFQVSVRTRGRNLVLRCMPARASLHAPWHGVVSRAVAWYLPRRATPRFCDAVIFVPHHGQSALSWMIKSHGVATSENDGVFPGLDWSGRSRSDLRTNRL